MQERRKEKNEEGKCVPQQFTLFIKGKEKVLEKVVTGCQHNYIARRKFTNDSLGVDHGVKGASKYHPIPAGT